MIFLILSIFFLALTFFLYSFFKKKVAANFETSSLSGKSEVIDIASTKTKEDNAKTDSSLNINQILILLIQVAVGLFFLVLYVAGRSTEKTQHTMAVSYEGFGVYSLGKNISAQFATEPNTGLPIETIIITPNANSVYITDLISQLHESLDPNLFKIVNQYSVTLPDALVPDYELSSSHLQDLLEENPDTKLVISLAGFTAESGYKPESEGRPYIAAFSEKAEMNDYVYLINEGMVDLVVLSKGMYANHSIIPDTLSLEEIFNNHFLIMNFTNASQIVKDFRQTVSDIPKNSQSNSSK